MTRPIIEELLDPFETMVMRFPGKATWVYFDRETYAKGPYPTVEAAVEAAEADGFRQIGILDTRDGNISDKSTPEGCLADAKIEFVQWSDGGWHGQMRFVTGGILINRTAYSTKEEAADVMLKTMIDEGMLSQLRRIN